MPERAPHAAARQMRRSACAAYRGAGGARAFVRSDPARSKTRRGEPNAKLSLYRSLIRSKLKFLQKYRNFIQNQRHGADCCKTAVFSADLGEIRPANAQKAALLQESSSKSVVLMKNPVFLQLLHSESRND
jgi:hypothetical protein